MFASIACAEKIDNKDTTMQTVKGAFDVNLTPAKDDVDMGRMVLDKVYSGALSGTAKGQMLSHRTQVQGSAAYVALEHFEGELEGKKGTFSLVHTGFMDKGVSSLEIKIVPDSGSGELEGIQGAMDIQIEDGKHFYTLEYQL